MKVKLLQLPILSIAALARGDLGLAQTHCSFELPAFFVGPECLSTWKRRAAQISEDPSVARWITRAAWATDRDVVVGRAGFHGRPEANGTAEVGYAVDPVFRRLGYGSEMLRALLEWAAQEPQVARIRACVGEKNFISRKIVEKQNFLPVGFVFDEVDGQEIVYERSAG